MNSLDAIRDCAAGRMRAAAVLLDMALDADQSCEGDDYLRRARTMLHPILGQLPHELGALLAEVL